jgi:hypothetical protein
LLHRVQAFAAGQSFDGHDGGTLQRGHRPLARARRLAVDVHRAGAALADPAAVLAAGQAERIAQHPQQRLRAVALPALGSAVDLEADRRELGGLCHVATLDAPGAHGSRGATKHGLRGPGGGSPARPRMAPWT